MPIQITVTEGLLSPANESKVASGLTELLLSMFDLASNSFMRPAVFAEIVVVPRGRTFTGGKVNDTAVVSLTLPNGVLMAPDNNTIWIKGATDILRGATGLPLAQIHTNLKHAAEGSWGLGGVAYDGAALDAAIRAAA